MAKQVSIIIENRPGSLKEITKILGDNKINIKALSISDSGSYGIVKLILDKPIDGCNAMKNFGISATINDIVAIKSNDLPGSLHESTAVLSNNNINVEDMYSFRSKNEDQAIFVFQVDNVNNTESILKEKGYNVLSENELNFI